MWCGCDEARAYDAQGGEWCFKTLANKHMPFRPRAALELTLTDVSTTRSSVPLLAAVCWLVVVVPNALNGTDLDSCSSKLSLFTTPTAILTDFFALRGTAVSWARGMVLASFSAVGMVDCVRNSLASKRNFFVGDFCGLKDLSDYETHVYSGTT